MKHKLSFSLKVLLLLTMGFTAWSYDIAEDSYGDDAAEVAVEAPEFIDQQDAYLSQAMQWEQTSSDSDETQLDNAMFLGVEAPTDRLGTLLEESAGQFGASTEMSFFSDSDLDVDSSFSASLGGPQYMMHDAGYMRNGMDNQLPTTIVANTNVAHLFQRYAALRRIKGAELPSDFSPLVRFVEEYIRTNARADAETKNGMTHRRLAIQVVRASMCFGTDPFMVLSKMRRETHFSRSEVSPTEAVGFSQMTGAGIREVQDQMSGDSSISMGNAKSTFQMAIRCFTGIENFQVPTGGRVDVQTRLTRYWALDMIFGQIMTKALVSYVKSGNSSITNTTAYRETFAMYNGDNAMTRGECLGQGSVRMRDEYACSVISHFNRMSSQWNRYITRSTGRDRT